MKIRATISSIALVAALVLSTGPTFAQSAAEREECNALLSQNAPADFSSDNDTDYEATGSIANGEDDPNGTKNARPEGNAAELPANCR